jgi:hypothetical protein
MTGLYLAGSEEGVICSDCGGGCSHQGGKYGKTYNSFFHVHVVVLLKEKIGLTTCFGRKRNRKVFLEVAGRAQKRPGISPALPFPGLLVTS